MEENETEPDSDSDYHLVFTALDELKLASWKSVFIQHSLQDDTLSFMESEDELRRVLKEQLGLKFGDAFKFSRLWFKKYYVKAEALNIPSQKESSGNDRQQVPTQEEKHQPADTDTQSFTGQTELKPGQGLDSPKRKEISSVDFEREIITEREVHSLVNKSCEDNQKEDEYSSTELQSTREDGFSSSQSEDILKTLPGSNEEPSNHPIYLSGWDSMGDGNETHDQDTCAGENKSGLADQLPGETMGEKEPSCLVNDVSQDENQDDYQREQGDSSGTENSTISREQVDYDINFPDSLRSARNATTSQHSTLGIKRVRQKRTNSKQTGSDQNGTEIEDRDKGGRTPTESDTSITFKSPSTGENSLENDLEENKTEVRREDSTAAKQRDNSIDLSTNEGEEGQSLFAQEKEVVHISTDEVHRSSSALQTSSKPDSDNVTVQEDGQLCQENLSQEKLYVCMDVKEPREDCESVLRCTPRPLGRKGRETHYRRGCVLDIEENREAEFKSLVSAAPSSLPWKIMEKAKKFICACLNADKRGIIYFGVGDCQEQESKYKRGEVLGLEVEDVMDDIVKAFQSVLDDHLKSDAGTLQKGGEQNCVSLEFVPVVSEGIRTRLYVIEIEVVRDWKFCKDNIYYSKSWTDKRGGKCDKNPVPKKALSDFYKVHKDEFDDVAIRTNGSSTSVKQHEVIKQVKEPLQAKYKEWKREVKLGTSDGISAAELSLEDADIKKYSKVVTERLRGFNFKDFGYILIANKLPPQYRGTPHLSFLQNIPWVAVFDLFDPSSKKDGLHYVCNETSDAPRAKIRTLDDFKEVSSDWISGKDFPLPTRGTTWILKNADMQKEDWIKNSKDCLYRALSAYNLCFPAGRLLCLFLGIGENAVQEMADIIECCFSILGNSATSCVTIITESKTVGEGFLKASKLSLQKELKDCSITGVPWALLKEIVREMVGPTKFEERGATTDLPYFTGKFKEVLNKVIHSWDDLEVYSPNPRLSTFTEEIEKERDAFYKGAHASQTNLFHNHSIQRTMEEEISSKVDAALKFLSKPSSDLNFHVKTVTVLYEPGSGATTLCRRILWNKRSDYRCAVVKAITPATDFQIEELQGIIYDEKNLKYSPPALVLVDNFSEIDTRHLTERITKRQTKCVILSTFAIAKSSTNFDFDITPLRQLDEKETILVKNILINITSDTERRREAEEVLDREKRFIWFGLELFGREYVKIEERLRNHINSTLAYLGDSQEIHEMVLHFCCFLHYYSDGRAILPHPVVSDFLYESSETNNQECAFMEHIHKLFGGLLLEGFNETNGYYGWRPAHSLVSEVVTSKININDTAILLLEKVHKGKAYANKFLKQQVFKVFLDRKRISEPIFLGDPGTDDDDSIDSDFENEILGFYEVRTRYSPLIVDILKGENGIQGALKLLITICEKATQTEDNAYAWQQLARFMGYEMRKTKMDIKDSLHGRLNSTMNFGKAGDLRIPMPRTGIEAAHIAVDIAINHQPNYSHHYVTKGVLYHLQLRDFMPGEHSSLLSSMPEVIDICRKAQEIYDKALSTTHALNHYSMIGKIQAIVSLLTIVKGLPCFRPEGGTFTRYLKNSEIPYDMRDALSTEEHKYVQSLSATTLDLLNQLFGDVKFRQMTTYNESEIRGLSNAKIRASKLRRAFYKVTGFDKSELSDAELRIPLSPLGKETPAVYQQIVQDILFKYDETPYSTWSNLSERDVSKIYNLLKVLCRRGYGSHDDMLICSKACLKLQDRPPVDELGEIVQKWVEKYPKSEWANLFNYMLHFPIPNRSLATDIQRTKMSIKKCDRVVREKTTWGYRKSGAEYFLGKGIGLYAIVTSQEFRWLEMTGETKTDFWRSREISEKLERVCGQKDVNFRGVITYQGIQLRFDDTRYPNQSKDDLWFYIGFSVAGPYAYDPVDNDSFAIMKRKAEDNARPSAVISNTSEQFATFAGGLSRGRPRDKAAKVPCEEPSDVGTKFETRSSDFPDLPQSVYSQAQQRISSSVPHSLNILPGVSDESKVTQKSSSSARLSPSAGSLLWSVSMDHALNQAGGTDQPTYASALQHGNTFRKEEQSMKFSRKPPTAETFSKRGKNWKSVQGSRGDNTRVFKPKYVDQKGRLHHGTPVRGAIKSAECKVHTGPQYELQVTSRCPFAHAWRGDTVQTVCNMCTRQNKQVCEERRTHVAYIWNLGTYYTEDGKIWKEPLA